MLLKRGGDLFEGKDVAPGRFQGMDLGAAAFHHVLHPGPEDAIDADDDFIARLDQVASDAFHARHAGAAHWESERILRAEDLAQEFAGFVHDGDILRIKVADRGRGQGAQHTLRNRAWAGPQKDALGRMGGSGKR